MCYLLVMKPHIASLFIKGCVILGDYRVCLCVIIHISSRSSTYSEVSSLVFHWLVQFFFPELGSRDGASQAQTWMVVFVVEVKDVYSPSPVMCLHMGSHSLISLPFYKGRVIVYWVLTVITH